MLGILNHMLHAGTIKFLHSDWASWSNQCDHSWLFKCALLKAGLNSHFFLPHQKAVNLEQLLVALFARLTKADLRVFACMELGQTIVLEADHTNVKIAKQMWKESFEQMWKQFECEQHTCCLGSSAALNWSQTSVSMIISLTHNTQLVIESIFFFNSDSKY